MTDVSEAEVEAAAKAFWETQNDEMTWERLAEIENEIEELGDARKNIRDGCRAAITAAARVRAVNVSGAQVEAALRELGILQPSVDDVARVSRAIMAAAQPGYLPQRN